MIYIAERARRACAFLFGMVYMLSGITKLLDPVGASLVMDAYFDFLHLGFLSFAAKPLGVFMAFLETLVGVVLMTGVWRKIGAMAAFGLHGFFTLITIILVIFKPDMDCGCFGEALSLSHTASLVKNIFLLLLLVAAFIPFRDLGLPTKKKYVSFGLVMLSIMAFAIWSWLSIPLVDYTDFAPGTMLCASDHANAGEEEMFESQFIYEKDGEERAFTLDDLPDSTWTFVQTRTVRIDGRKEAVFSFSDIDGQYHDELATEGQVMLVTAYSRKGLDWTRIADFVDVSQNLGFNPLVVVSGNVDVPADMVAYRTDYKTAVTINRSNGGVTYINNGQIITKWPARSMPDTDTLAETYVDDETEILEEHSSRRRLLYHCFRLFLFAVILLV